MSVNTETFELGFIPMLSDAEDVRLAVNQGIDLESNIIRGAQVTMKGEIPGHDIKLDDTFLNRVVKLGNEAKDGIKMRAGHPEMFGGDALGSFLGVRKNFKKQGDFVFADMIFSSAANPEMKAHIFAMAKEHPSMLGSSVAITGKRNFSKDENEMPTMVLQELLAIDVVDTPAAGTGMFSQRKQLLDGEQETEEVNSMTDQNKEVLAALKDKEAEEQLKERDAKLLAAQDEIVALKKDAAISKTKAEVIVQLSKSDLPDAAKAKIAEQFAAAENCDGLDEALASEAAYIQAVQFSAEAEETEEGVKDNGHDAHQLSAEAGHDDHDKRMDVYLANHPDADLGDVYKATMKKEVA